MRPRQLSGDFILPVDILRGSEQPTEIYTMQAERVQKSAELKSGREGKRSYAASCGVLYLFLCLFFLKMTRTLNSIRKTNNKQCVSDCLFFGLSGPCVDKLRMKFNNLFD